MGDSNQMGRIPLGGQLGRPFQVPVLPRSGYFEWWDSSKWYPAGEFVFSGGSFGPGYAAGNDAADIIYAWPKIFTRSGVITDIAQHCGNNNGRMWLGIYDSNTATPWIPRNRLVDGERVAVGFHQAMVISNVNLTISAGRVYWFAQVFNANVPGGGILQTSPAFAKAWLGSDYTGAAGAATANNIVAIRTANAYGQLPAVFPAPTYWKQNQAAMGVMMYKFTPTAGENP
jgi:hypothetical protein